MSVYGESAPPHLPEDWDFLETALIPEQLDRDLFRSRFLLTPPGARGTFGGQLIALALQCATETIDDPEKVVNSLHSNFLLPGDSSRPVYFRVLRIRDGKGFANRFVTALQNGEAIYIASISFHRREQAGLKHQVVMPENIPAPEDALFEREVLGRMIATTKSDQLKENLRRKMSKESPIVIRYVSNPTLKAKGPVCAWLKSASVKGATPQMHRAVAAMASDFFLAMAVIVPHGLTADKLRMLVSLDHTIYFHEDFRADEWFLYQVQSDWANGNRGLVRGHIYSRDGRLVMTTVQEALVRLSPGFESVAKL